MNTTGTLLRSHRHGGREGMQGLAVEHVPDVQAPRQPASRCSHAPPPRPAGAPATGGASLRWAWPHSWAITLHPLRFTVSARVSAARGLMPTSIRRDRWPGRSGC